MTANNGSDNVSITFNQEEAIVLLEWLSIFNKKEDNSLFSDQAEQRILWDIECELEKVIHFTSNDYNDFLESARQKIRDKE